MTFNLIQFKDLQEGTPVLAFGVHMLKWNFQEWGDPTYAFIDDEVENELLAACEQMLLFEKATSDTNDESGQYDEKYWSAIKHIRAAVAKAKG